MKKEKPIIVVATNSLTEAQYPAYTNHVQQHFSLGRYYRNYNFVICNPSRMSIDRMRNLAAKTALEVNAKYLLFLDDDVLVQPDGLAKLLACKADIAAGKVVIRGYPFDWMAFRKKGKDGGLYALSKMNDKGIEEVDAVGFSFCLIKTDVLRTMNAPWFVTGLNNTEDIYFCVKAREINPKLKIVVNNDVLAGHILWPEVMDANNRDAYRKYFETINPGAKLDRLMKKRNPRHDRSQAYLDSVKEVANAK